MTEQEFVREVHHAQLAREADTGRADYWRGFERGLRRGFHGERFGTAEEHAHWLTLAAEAHPRDEQRRNRGRGYLDGLAAAAEEPVEEEAEDADLDAAMRRPMGPGMPPFRVDFTPYIGIDPETAGGADEDEDEDPVYEPDTGRQIDMLRAMGLDPEAMGAKSIGGELYKPDASPTARPCARCGRRPAAWIAGAGEALCSRHQDDY